MSRSTTLLLLTTCLYSYVVLSREVLEDFVDGDVLVGYYDDMDRNSTYLTQNYMSFLAAISDQSYWPDGIKVGYVSWHHDDKQNGIQEISLLLRKYPKLVALVGFRTETANLQLSPFLTGIKLPGFCYGSGVQKDLYLQHVHEDEYMTSITSTKTTQVRQTLPRILDKLGVNIISVVYDETKGEELCQFNKELDLGNRTIDVEYHHFYDDGDQSTKSVDAIKTYLRSKTEAETTRYITMVLLLSGKRISTLAQALIEDGLISNVIFITDSSGCTSKYLSDLDFEIKDLENITLATLRLCQTRYQEPAVQRFVQDYRLYARDEQGNIAPKSNVLDEFYQKRTNNVRCVEEENDGCKTLDDFLMINVTEKHSRYNHRIYYTVRKILKALENITSDEIGEVSTRTFEDIILRSSNSEVGQKIRNSFLENHVELPENESFLRFYDHKLDEDYEVEFKTTNGKTIPFIWTSSDKKEIFKRKMDEIRVLIENNTTGRHLACSLDCKPGHKTVTSPEHANCWSCLPCTGNTYSPAGAACTPCDTVTDSRGNALWANEERTGCTTRPRSVGDGGPAGVAVWIITGINILVALFTIVIYVIYWKNKVIVSSGKDLACTMFIGIILGHVEALLIAATPSDITCTAIQIVGHVFMMLISVPLLIKTLRIWLVFKYSVKLGRKIKDYISTWVIVTECLVLMLPQAVLLVIGMTYNVEKFRFKINYVEESLEGPIIVTESCGPQSFSLMLASIIYTGVLLLLSTALGWDCRKLPDNFKESMHIFMSSLISLLLTVSYVPAIMTMAGYTQVALLAGAVSVISLALNAIIFLPKVYVVLFVPIDVQRQMSKRSTSGVGSSAAIAKPPFSNDTHI